MTFKFTGFQTVSPENWGLPRVGLDAHDVVQQTLGVSTDEIVSRCKNSVYSFVNGLYDEEVGALHHYYRSDTQFISEFDSGNFLMALNFVVMYDLFQDPMMLERATSCFEFAMREYCDDHPMAFWQGGVRDGFRPSELWLKYTGDAFWLALALNRRSKSTFVAESINKFHNFFKRSKEAGFRYTFDTENYSWRDKGNVWKSFGFPITCYMEMYEATENGQYLQQALEWGDHALSLQAPNGAFYLIDDQFWNSDLAAPELRGLVYLWEATHEQKYLDSAINYANWMLQYQRTDGAWPLGVDRDGEICVATVGPGDTPNIALSLIRLHGATGEDAYLQSAIRAVKYGMSMQACESGKYPLHLDDPHVKWGFWSWEPLYDYSLSGDQSVHHIRGQLFLSSYLMAIAKQQDS